MARLIDSYADGFIEKAEFESRITRFRQRVVTLETQLQEIAQQQALEEELHSVISRLEDFAAQVTGGLDATDWDTRRQLLRILVKRVEIGEDDVNIVFRIPPDFGRLAAHEESLQHCRRSGLSSTHQYDIGWAEKRTEGAISSSQRSQGQSGALCR
ncbi:MAG: hypothetical protein GY796_05250 [Chloroflexi bacterium]|nr:hypothetical protein [Chloroflexota bacterium]